MIEWLRHSQETPQIVLGDQVLPIELHRHPRARRLTLRLAPDGCAVRITLPRWCRSADAIAFAHARSAWLTEQLSRLPRQQDPLDRGAIRYRGSELPFIWHRTYPRRAEFNGAGLELGGPRERLAERLRSWLEAEALRLAGEDLAHYCKQAGVAPPELRLTRARRRWGSCSSRDIVRINWRLVQAPDEVRRSVVAHETAHLVHFDHGPAFHSLLNSLFESDLSAAEKWLREHGRELFSDFG